MSLIFLVFCVVFIVLFVIVLCLVPSVDCVFIVSLGTRHRTMTNNTTKTQSTLGTRHRTMTNNTIKTQSTLGTRRSVSCA
jgi:hypothetical protein